MKIFNFKIFLLAFIFSFGFSANQTNAGADDWLINGEFHGASGSYWGTTDDPYYSCSYELYSGNYPDESNWVQNGSGSCGLYNGEPQDTIAFYYKDEGIYWARVKNEDTGLFMGFYTMTVDVYQTTYSENVPSPGSPSGTTEIIYPSADETVDGSAFITQVSYWNYGDTVAPYDQIYYQVTDKDLNVLDMGFQDIETDNVKEEKTAFISEIIIGSFPDSILTVALYNSATQAGSDTTNQTFNIVTYGATEQYYNYSLRFYKQMDYDKFGQPSKTYNNLNDQELLVNAHIGDIPCDSITSGYFEYNSYTDSTFSTIAAPGVINRFEKGGLYQDCQFDEVFLYLKATPADPGPVYYQVDFFEDTGKTKKLAFLRFVIFYNLNDGQVGGDIWENPNQDFFCDDLTIYLPNYIGDPFEIKILNKICAFIIPPPNYFTTQVARVNAIFSQKIDFANQAKTKFLSASTAIASGSTSPPQMTSGSWHGASFNLQDMFAGSTSFMPWVRSFMSVVLWLGFIVWFFRDFKTLFVREEKITS